MLSNYLDLKRLRQRVLQFPTLNNMLNVIRSDEPMKSSDEIVSLIEQIVSSGASRDETLGEAVRLLKQEREQYNWVGIYLLEGDMLVLHNYIGKPTDHTHIPVGRGVCGTAVAERMNKTIGDVRELDNYLACSLETRAEIVVLIRRGDSIFGQIDIDSDTANAFNSEDESLLSQVADLLA